MNFARVVASAVVAWIVHLGLTTLVWSTLLPDAAGQNASLLRPPAEMNLTLGFAVSLLGFFVFAYAYAKGYEGGPGAVEGLRYVMMPISGSFAAAMTVDAVVEMAVFGVVVGLIYKPHASRK